MVYFKDIDGNSMQTNSVQKAKDVKNRSRRKKS